LLSLHQDIEPAERFMRPPLTVKRTPLEKQLQGGACGKASPLSAFAEASLLFARGRRLDMVQLAEKLGVSRATLYRWVGSREALLMEVVWAGVQPIIQTAEASSSAKGGAYVAEVLASFIAQVVNNAAMNAFLDREGEAAMRLLTLADGGFQKRIVAWVQQLVEGSMKSDEYLLTLPADELAYAVVRLGESYIYKRFITGQSPDLQTVEPLFKLLLR
jgi:AcrR family transcriptional regulator